jgi:hypothetical protein
LDNVNFKIDSELNKKFKILNIILNQKNQNILPKLIERYVIDNYKYVTNSRIKKTEQPVMPAFFAYPMDWFPYIHNLNSEDYVDMATRVTFLKYSLLQYKFERRHNIAFNTLLKNTKDNLANIGDFSCLSELGIYDDVNYKTKQYGEDFFDGVLHDGL